MNKPQTGVLVTGVTHEEEQAAREKELGRRLAPSSVRVKGPKEALALYEKRKKKKKVSKRICPHCGQPLADISVRVGGLVTPEEENDHRIQKALRAFIVGGKKLRRSKAKKGIKIPSVSLAPHEPVSKEAQPSDGQVKKEGKKYRRNLKKQGPMFRRRLAAMKKKARGKKLLAELRLIKIRLS